MLKLLYVEGERQITLPQIQALPSADLENLVSLAAALCDTERATIKFCTQGQVLVKARFCFDEIPPYDSDDFLNAVVKTKGVTVICDATKDVRVSAHPYVAGALAIRFFAGAPIIDDQGSPVGAM